MKKLTARLRVGMWAIKQKKTKLQLWQFIGKSFNSGLFFDSGVSVCSFM